MHERKDVATWDETFMDIAKIAAKRSKDPTTQVGAIFVSADNRRTALGYNGAPRNFSDELFPWGKGNDNELDNKYPFVIHAERNALDNVSGDGDWLKNSTLYVTHSPCHQCAQSIANKEVKRVVYNELRYDKFTEHLFNICGIDMIKFSDLESNPKT